MSEKKKKSMGLKIILGLAFSLLFSFCSECLSAQEYLIHKYSEINGLPSSYVFDIAQDQIGRMWFATNKGIVAFDGINWNKYLFEDGVHSLASFFKIKIDHRDTVWVLTYPGSNAPGTVCCYERGKWKQIPGIPKNIFNAKDISAFELFEQSQGTPPWVMVGTRSMGLFLWDGYKWNHLTTQTGLLSDKVNGIATENGNIYIATDRGLCIYKQPKLSYQFNDELWTHFPASSIGIKAIKIQYKDRYSNDRVSGNRIWLLSDDWAGYFENNAFTPIYYWPNKKLFENETEISLLPDYQNGIYIGSNLKICYYDLSAKKMETLGVTNGLISGESNSMFIDFEKNIWIASSRGVSKIASRRFGNFQTKNGLLEDDVTAITEYAPGKFVLGHTSGLTFYDGTTFRSQKLFMPRHGLNSSSERIMDLKSDSRGNIWAGIANASLMRIDAQGNTTSFYSIDGQPLQAHCLWIDPDDTVWAGTPYGVFYLENGVFVPLKIDKSKKLFIRKIYKPSKNIFYFATTSDGLYRLTRYKTDRWENFKSPQYPAANNIFAVHEAKGRVLLGTPTGLFTIRNGKVVPFDEKGFKLDRTIFFILEDKNHCLWFGLDNGVMRWDGNKAIQYTTLEGLVGQETNRAAYLADNMGRLWIGTNLGVSVYNPAFDIAVDSPPAPRVHLLALECSDYRITFAGQKDIQLSYSNNNIMFSFKAISFMDENRLRYQTWMERLDNGWSEEYYPYNQTIRYQNLQAGRYRFKFRARNVLGTWSKVVVSPEIVISKPFFQQWYFYLLILGLVGMMSGGFIRYFSERKYALKLEKQVKERTKELRAAEEKYSALFLESKDVVYFSTMEGKFTDINPAGVELFGYCSKEEILAANIDREIYAHPEDRENFQKEIEKNGYVKDYEVEVRRKDGKTLVVLLTVTLVQNEAGDVVAYRGIMRDITQKKKLEEQLERIQKMEAIGTLAGGVAHDLNNILSGLTSYPELLLLQIPQESPLRKPLQTIKRTGEKAAAVVQDLLTLSRRGVAVNEVVNLNDIIRDYLSSPECKKLISYHPDARIDVVLDPNLLNVVGSPIHLFKTTMNLVSNAVEAMPKGGWVRIRTENRFVSAPLKGFDTISEGRFVVLKITDDGVGISQEDLTRIFEPFYTRKKMGRSGTGLGMSVVWATVKDHNGYIDIRTQEGKGSTFELYFPGTTQKKPEKEVDVCFDRYRGEETILIIDDVEEQREVATKILSSLGYRAVAVCSGEKAVEYLRSECADLLIIDMILEAGINGLETYRRILNIRPKQKAIIVSGFSETGEVKELLKLGAGTYIKKPYTLDQLGRAVREELDSEKN
ncbi:MAG: ATP-binding protein [Candidatus Omnitrophota bacterium]